MFKWWAVLRASMLPPSKPRPNQDVPFETQPTPILPYYCLALPIPSTLWHLLRIGIIEVLRQRHIHCMHITPLRAKMMLKIDSFYSTAAVAAREGGDGKAGARAAAVAGWSRAMHDLWISLVAMLVEYCDPDYHTFIKNGLQLICSNTLTVT